MRVHIGCSTTVFVPVQALVLLRRAGMVAGLLFGFGLLAMVVADRAAAEEQPDSVVEPVAPVVRTGADLLSPVVRPLTSAVAPVTQPVARTVVTPVAAAAKPVLDTVAPVTDPLVKPLLQAAKPVVAPITEATGLERGTPAVKPPPVAKPPAVAPSAAESVPDPGPRAE